MTIKVGINGMGRIGRMVIRAIIESQNKNIEIKHINNRSNSEASCALLKYDSIHGKFNADLDYDKKHLIINKDKIYTKVISVPCQDIFDLQSKIYKKKILGETKFKVSIEAASTDCWKKYVGTEGLTFGIDAFGKSAPYEEIYKYFGLTAENITKKTKNLIKSKV